ncbi:MAG: YkgJ family cysteine cluster protein [Phycisphaerae bacterium]|nr:YkgJ family cysteine cluster protein [Gemmatimonadaceae bacterium]
MTAKPIHLGNAGGAIDIHDDDVYFPFSSGRFAYDCVACNAKCCRGHGFLATVGAELATQLRLRPTLPLFLEPSTPEGAQYLMHNCAPGCFFLSSEGRCDIHASEGPAAKPETCRLFPFNDFLRVGRTLVVRPHGSLCPLQVTPPGVKSECSSHQALKEAMQRPGIFARIRQAHATSDAIAVERTIVHLSEQAAGCTNYLQLVAQMVDAQRSAMGEAGSAAFVPNVQRTIAFARQLLSTPSLSELENESEVCHTMMAMTPFLRSYFVFQVGEAPQATNENRVLPLAPIKIPFALLSVFLLAVTARQSGMRDITFQTISQLQRDFLSLVTMMADLDSVLVLREGVPVELRDFGRSPHAVALTRATRALLPTIQSKRRARLGDVLLEHAPGDPLLRGGFTKDIARIIVGKVVDLGEERRARHQGGWRARSRSQVERWTLRYVDDQILSLMFKQIQGRP